MPMRIVSCYLQEQRRYSKDELAQLLKCSTDDVQKLIRMLKSYGVLKAVRNTPDQKELSDLLDEETEIADETAGNDQYLYVFTYVGIITIGRRILKIYPKYLLNAEEPLSEMKQILKVLEKYSSSEEEIVTLYNGDGENRQFNLLAVILYLLNDYYEYGVYNNSEEIIEVNGEGTILWEKTINENYAVIIENRPYYAEIFTEKKVDDDLDYFTRLHKAVITDCSRQLEESQLAVLFEMETVRLTDEDLESFGDRDYILDRIAGELGMQFNTRRQILLKTLSAYINQEKKLVNEDNGISMYGTASFNLVWERVCAKVFNNRLQTRLDRLPLPLPLAEKFDPRAKLIDIIEKPVWSGTDFSKPAAETLIPDIASLVKLEEKYWFVILDAKYYNLHLEKDKKLKGYPGVGDVSKQYLYQLAFNEFIQIHGFKEVRNCFLLPTDKDKVICRGCVSMSVLRNLGLEDIQVRFLPARKAFDAYLRNQKIPLNELAL